MIVLISCINSNAIKTCKSSFKVLDLFTEKLKSNTSYHTPILKEWLTSGFIFPSAGFNSQSTHQFVAFHQAAMKP